MLLISHRGNLNGPNYADQNRPQYIQYALVRGFDVEVDVWYVNDKFYLGHDEPEYILPNKFLDFSERNHLWFHCKNVEALNEFVRMDADETLKFFFHQDDDVTLTSNKKLWTYPGKTLMSGSIAVLPEMDYDKNADLWQCYAICTDYVYKYRRLYEDRNIG